MNSMETLGLALGTGFSSGLNLYATVATLGLLQRSGVLRLPPGLQVLSHPWVLGIALALYLIEFLADKIPYFDTIWDAIHTFIRPPAAALLAYAAAGGAAPEWRWGATLIAGGIALTAHGTKASARAAVNASPEPFSNWAFKFGRRRYRRLADLDGHGPSARDNGHHRRTHRALSLLALSLLPLRAPRRARDFLCRLKQRQYFPGRSYSGADRALIRRAGLHTLGAKRYSADLLSCVETCRRHANRLPILVDWSAERPSRLRINHAVPPAVEINGPNVPVEINVPPCEDAVQVSA